MQNAARYRQFAETLITVAQDADAETRDMILSAARTWQSLADEAEGASLEVQGQGQVISFIKARRTLRPQARGL